MKRFLLFLCLASGVLGGFLNKRACNADNCARAVTGTRFAASIQALHTADCSSFMIVTVTPATPVTTITITPTSYSVIGSNAKRTAVPEIAARDTTEPWPSFFPTPAAGDVIAVRQVTQVPNQVPMYASACVGTARYSSACSCAGITETTTFAPTPATYTSTAYAATSVVPVCDPTNNYDLTYGYGVIPYGLQVIVPPPTAISEAECCAACWSEGSACFIWAFFDNLCHFGVEVAGDHTPTDYCPYGQWDIPGTTPGAPNGYAFGPCYTPY